MILFKRALPFLGSISIFAFLEIMVARGNFFWIFAGALLVLHCVLFWYLVAGHHEKKVRFQLLFEITIFLLSSVFFLIFLTDHAVAQVLIILATFFYGLYTENIFYFLYNPQRYQPYALEHIANYLNILSFFMFFGGLFASRIFLNVTLITALWIGILGLILFVFLLFQTNKLESHDAMLQTFVYLLVMIELLGVVSFLPTSYFVSSVLLTIPYYLMGNLVRHNVRGTLRRGVIFRYLSVGISTFVLALLTAPWS